MLRRYAYRADDPSAAIQDAEYRVRRAKSTSELRVRWCAGGPYGPLRCGTRHLHDQLPPYGRDPERRRRHLCVPHPAPHPTTTRERYPFHGPPSHPCWQFPFAARDPSTRTRVGSFRSYAPRLSGRSHLRCWSGVEARHCFVPGTTRHHTPLPLQGSDRQRRKRSGFLYEATLRQALGRQIAWSVYIARCLFWSDFWELLLLAPPSNAVSVRSPSFGKARPYSWIAVKARSVR